MRISISYLLFISVWGSYLAEAGTAAGNRLLEGSFSYWFAYLVHFINFMHANDKKTTICYQLNGCGMFKLAAVIHNVQSIVSHYYPGRR